jgi:hypothetical protein
LQQKAAIDHCCSFVCVISLRNVCKKSDVFLQLAVMPKKRSAAHINQVKSCHLKTVLVPFQQTEEAAGYFI